jgi:hypothetical protein
VWRPGNYAKATDQLGCGVCVNWTGRAADNHCTVTGRAAFAQWPFHPTGDIRMKTRAHTRRRLAAAVLTSVLGATSVARAADPPPVQPAQVEIFHGAKKVWPLSAPPVQPPPKPVVPAESKGGPVVEEPGRASAAFMAACAAVRDGSTSVTKSATNLLDRISDRMAVQTEARQIMLASFIPPPSHQPQPAPPANLPWLTPTQTQTPPTQPAAVSTPQTPTVVVIRETAPDVHRVEVPVAAPTLPEPRGVVMTPELMIAAGFGVFGLMFGLAAWARGGRAARSQYAPVVGPVLAVAGGVRLQGKYDAGPVPESAEKFDLGPTYHDELQEKKHVEVRSNEAVVQFILDQNLALLDALGPVAEEIADDEFEISAN